MGPDVPPAGLCRACRAVIWRTVIQQREQNGAEAGEVYLLWPMPGAVFAIFHTDTGYAPGLGYCAGCAPEIGGAPPSGVTARGHPVALGGCIGHETAKDRYAAQWTDDFGEHLAAWLLDQAGYDADGAATIVESWRRDRVAA